MFYWLQCKTHTFRYRQTKRNYRRTTANIHGWIGLRNYLYSYSMWIVCKNKIRFIWDDEEKYDSQINDWIVILCVVKKTSKKYDVNLFYMYKISIVNFIRGDFFRRKNECRRMLKELFTNQVVPKNKRSS
jgi:hypothetical protein